MKCSKCSHYSRVLHKGYCLNCLWNIITPCGIAFRMCINCGVTKPVDMYKGNDSTCTLCRKLITVTSTRFSHKQELSMATMLDANIHELAWCRTCELPLHIDDFPQNSFECITCWGWRSIIEVVRVGEQFDGYMMCFSCFSEKLLSTYPVGRVTCRSCINKQNASSCL